MAEYIERQEVHSKINELPLTEDAVMEILWAVDDIPAADVAPVVHGRWEIIRWSDASCCSRCGIEFNFGNSEEFIFCPNCGAKMDL